MVDKTPQKLITQMEFSIEAGVSRAAVSKAATRGLKGAIVDDRIDIAHPDAQAYIKHQQDKKTKKPATKRSTTKKPAAKKRPAKRNPVVKPLAKGESVPLHFKEEEALLAVLDLTLRELIKRHGTARQFKTWVDASKVIADIRNKDLKSAELEGLLIPRATVKTHLFGAIENNNKRLLTDMPKTITRRLDTLLKAGTSIEDCEATVRDLLSGHVKGIKAAATRVLRNV